MTVSRGTSTGYAPVELLSDLPYAVVLFEGLHEGMEILVDYEWTDPDTGVLMGEQKLHSEVIAEWTR